MPVSGRCTGFPKRNRTVSDSMTVKGQDVREPCKRLVLLMYRWTLLAVAHSYSNQKEESRYTSNHVYAQALDHTHQKKSTPPLQNTIGRTSTFKWKI
jgi:hypothetical protein